MEINIDETYHVAICYCPLIRTRSLISRILPISLHIRDWLLGKKTGNWMDVRGCGRTVTFVFDQSASSSRSFLESFDCICAKLWGKKYLLRVWLIDKFSQGLRFTSKFVLSLNRRSYRLVNLCKLLRVVLEAGTLKTFTEDWWTDERDY